MTRNFLYVVGYLTVTMLVWGVVAPTLISMRDHFLPWIGYLTIVVWVWATMLMAKRFYKKVSSEQP